MDLDHFKKQSTKLYPDNTKRIAALKKKKKLLDPIFQAAHETVFAEVDCLECANCCKTTSPIFYQGDIERMSKTLKMKPSVFIDQYLVMDDDQDWVLKEAPCPFLGHDNKCIVYESRPTACREYPHTNRKRVFQILDLTLKNTLVCPAVLEILQVVSSALNWKDELEFVDKNLFGRSQ